MRKEIGKWKVNRIGVLYRRCRLAENELTLLLAKCPKDLEPRKEIVFKLKDKDYTTRCSVTQYNYEYDEDEIITLPIPHERNVNRLFGHGFDALMKEISKGII